MNKTRALFLNLLALIAIFSFASFTQAQQSSALKPLDAKYVCMITNQEFVKEQIPVEVDGKTYYGCCEMCKAKIKNNAQARVAIDPVSGNQVDKAVAVIGSAPDGSIYYFESEENMSSYNPYVN